MLGYVIRFYSFYQEQSVAILIEGVTTPQEAIQHYLDNWNKALPSDFELIKITGKSTVSKP